jgi:hypothetical protein
MVEPSLGTKRVPRDGSIFFVALAAHAATNPLMAQARLWAW